MIISMTVASFIDFETSSVMLKGTVIGITQPPPKEGAWSALFSNL